MEPSIAFPTVDFAEPTAPPPGGSILQESGVKKVEEPGLHEDWGLFSFFQITCCGKSIGPRRTKQLLGCLCGAVLLLLVATVVVVIMAETTPAVTSKGFVPSGVPAATPMSGGVGTDTTCSDRPCQHSGVCITPPSGRGVLCDCTDTGFVGDRCEAELDACFSVPCRHGGTCIDHVQSRGYMCQCPDGYAGEECEVEVDDCASSPCQNRGLCIDEQSAYHCSCCGTGFIGEHCEYPSAECPAGANSCDPQHSCCTWDAVAGTAHCECDLGWGGPTCSEETDACNPNPCQNAAACVDLYNDFQCNCPRGFGGDLCGDDVDECRSSPCHQAGTLSCSDGVDSYYCTCLDGWSGEKCEEDVDECARRPCLNGGICDDSLTQSFISPGAYYCSCLASYFGARYTGLHCEQDIGCPAGHSGANCVDDIDECASHPCRNGATCLDSTTHGPIALGLYQCECTAGWYGHNCESDVNECDSSPCVNGGTCSQRPGQTQYDCRCPRGYSGHNCEENLLACESSPCENDGVCVDRVNAYRCLCGPNFDGDNCEIPLFNDHCTLDPCQNGGICHMEHTRAVCQCRQGWAGEYCTSDTEAGSGSSVDISNLHGPDGSFQLRDRSLFSDEADGMITNVQLGESSAPETSVYRTVVEFMQDYTIALGISYIDGDFSRDNWIGSIRQRAFAARDKKVYGISTMPYQKNVRAYHASLPLHVEFAAAIDNLPRHIQSPAQKADYLNLIDQYGTHFVRRETYGGVLKNAFFVLESDYALHADAIITRARDYFDSLLGSSIASAADNAQGYLTLLDETVRLRSLHFSAVGGTAGYHCTNSTGGMTHDANQGECESVRGQSWGSDMAAWIASVEADPALINVELAPLADLIPDGTKRENMHTVVLDYLRTCTWTNNTHHPMCSNRGSCLVETGTCNCDPGFYPTGIGSDTAPCSLFSCPKRMQIECAGHGDCNSKTGVCTCEPEWDGPDCDTDVDECQDVLNACTIADRVCHNLPGSFECLDCIAGYEEDGNGFCANIDECAADPTLCAGLECIDEVGSYRCGQCEPGYTPNPAITTECEDIDECAEANNECTALFESLRPCVNQPGSYTCGDCLDGYVQTYNGFCEDINECENPPHGAYCSHESVDFTWVDAQSEGQLGPPLNDDDDFQMTLPFKFTYYGDIKEVVHISSNGYLFFDGGTLAYGETSPIPSQSVPNDIVSPYWTDLDPTTCGSVYTLGTHEQFVIEWVDIPYFNLRHSCSNRQHFEAIMHRDGSITFLYQSISANPNYWAPPAIGVENEDGTNGWRVAHCTRGPCPHPVSSGSAILLTPCIAEPGSTVSTGDGRWDYPCPDHATCQNTVGSHECTCDPGYGTAECTPKQCTVGTTIPGSDRDAGTAAGPCSGITGDVCEYHCLDGMMQFGEHVCGYGGAFFGGMCIESCHTLQVDGDCFDSFNGLYTLMEDEQGETTLSRGQPQFSKHDSRDLDEKLLHWDGAHWALRSTVGDHGVCADCPQGAGNSNNYVESMVGSHQWQLGCGSSNGGGMATQPIHLQIDCMVLCADVCDTAGNGVCEDGAAGSVQPATCHYGTDCRDCGARDTGAGEQCVEPVDEAGFTCQDYVAAGYSCLQMVTYYAKDCSCTCANDDGSTDSSNGSGDNPAGRR
jgi:hypothetical protein